MSDYQKRDPKAVLAEVNERKKQAEGYRRRYEADWFLDLSFYEGEQWVAWDGRGLFRPKLAPGRITLTDNRIQPIVRTEVAKLTKQRPGWGTTPRGADDEAIQDATTSKRLLEWGYDHLMFAPVRREAITWARVCGAGFIKTTWDKTLGEQGEEVVVKEDGSPVVNPESGRIVRAGEFPELEQIPGARVERLGGGDVRLEVRSPFDIYPDPLATSLEDCRWLIDESVKSPDYIKEAYEQTVAPDAPAMVGVTQSRMQGSGGSSGGSGEHVGVRVWEMWEKPSEAKPEGCHVVWCHDRILYEGPNEYGWIPYDMVPGVIVPGRFWPSSVVSQLRPIQARLNKLISQIAENASRFGNPSLLIDALANVKYSGVPGEQIVFNGTTSTSAPQFLSPPSMPSYVFQLVGQVEQALREISGQNEVSSGGVPAGVTAASAISLLQEQDATRLGPDVEAMETVLASVGQKVLTLMVRYYQSERIIVIVGEDGVLDIDSFRSHVDFQIPDVRVEANSTFPRSLAARQAAIRDMLNLMLQYGVPISADAMAKTLREMQVGGLEQMIQGFTSDQAQVARENADFLRGVQPLVGPVDNDEIHLAAHEDVAKSARFRKLPPEQQQMLYEHILAHKQRMMMRAAPTIQGINPAPQQGGDPTAIQGQPSGNPAPMQEPFSPQG